MDATGWAAVAAVAAAVTALITLVIAYANASETRTANQSADFANCLAVVSALAEAQRRVFNSTENPALHTFEFNELLNLMEALAGLHNDLKLTASTRKITEDFLDEAWAYLSADPATQALVANTVTAPSTYAELMKFSRRRGSKSAALTAAYRIQMADRGSRPSAPLSSAESTDSS
jgi:hypothetical protein